jgi:2-isopropylmalate synthase
MNREIKIYDTTLRDGAQSVGISFSLADKLKIAQALDDFGVHYIEGGWPGSNPKDIAFFQEARKLNFKNARLSAFSSTKLKGIDIKKDPNILELLGGGTPAVTIFGKSWDLHVKKALNISLEENLQLIFQTIDYLKTYFDEIIFDAEHFFDGYKKNPRYALKTLLSAQDAGSDWIVLCDTNGGTMTNECQEIVAEVKKRIECPLGIHTHNDSELAVANSMIAVDGGVDLIQGTINGIGERCGNANLCSIIPNLSLKKNLFTTPGHHLKNLRYLSRLLSELANQRHPKNLPFVGKHAFAHKGGVHVSAVIKEPTTYEHIAPESVGNQRFVSISELSGKSNVLEKVKGMGLRVNKNSPNVNKVLSKVKQMESQGYSFEGAEASFELLYKSLLGRVKNYFTLHGYRVITWKNSKNKPWAEATIKASVPEDISRRNGIKEPLEHTSADGEGPVEALDKALRKVLERFYPQLKEVKLSDYKVRILNEAEGTSAVTRVLINSRDKNRRWGTVGVSDNIIDASWQALTESLIYKLLKDEEDKEKLT